MSLQLLALQVCNCTVHAESMCVTYSCEVQHSVVAVGFCSTVSVLDVTNVINNVSNCIKLVHTVTFLQGDSKSLHRLCCTYDTLADVYSC
jgi:hypothetical protein